MHQNIHDAQLPVDESLADDEAADVVARDFLFDKTKHAMAKHKIKKAAVQDVTRLCCEQSRTHVPEALTMSRTLHDLCRWDAIPGTAETCVHFFDAREACSKNEYLSKSMQNLASSWHERHRGLLKLGGDAKRLPGLRGTACRQAGLCHCGRTAEGRLLKKVWLEMRKGLQHIFANKISLDALVAGQCVVMFFAVMRKESDVSEVLHRCVAVPLQYLKPWRPTFLELETASDADADKLKKMLSASLSAKLEDDMILTMKVLEVDIGKPRYLTALEFAQSLNAKLDWHMRVCWLSDSVAPFVNSIGKVRVVFRSQDKDIAWWKPVEEDCVDDDAMFEMFDDPSSSHRPPDTPDIPDGVKSDSERADNSDDGDDQVEDDFLQFDQSLLALWDEMMQTEQIDDRTPDVQEKVDSDKDKVDVKKSLSSDSNSSTSSSSSVVKVEETTNKVKTLGVARDRSHSEHYGMHILTERFNSGTLTGYQMRCMFPSHAKCTKELSNSVTGSSEGTRRVLKAWSLLSSLYNSRESHMAVRQDLLDALRNDTLLSEPELDLFKMGDAQDEIAGPFRAHSPAALPSEASEVGILGQRGARVPEQVHQTMEQWCLSGKIPKSTLTQRERQRAVTNTHYEIPAPLAPALRHGYISPNLPPPQGMKWVCKAGTWRLRHRGG